MTLDAVNGRAYVSGKPLQVIRIDMDKNEVVVNDEAMDILQKNIEDTGVTRLSIVSMMGAFRTGKSFMLDVFLRYLRFGDAVGPDHQPHLPNVPRDQEYPVPEWLLKEGENLKDGDGKSGFHWRGGMEKCTEGIWIWSRPFVRKLPGSEEKVAVIIMDTQGAWDSRLTKEQSATVFGLTAVLSSKQIYNISKQIQEDKIGNLHYFMEFANAAIRVQGGGSEEEAKAFQTLEFLVRDWPNFEDDWERTRCEMQAKAHLAAHMDPNQAADGTATIEALHNMFNNITAYCLPHPGLKIEKSNWTGDIADLDRDFLRFLDAYVHTVFDKDLAAKSIMNQDLTGKSFGPILRAFVEAFKDAAPAATSFADAMSQSTSLLAKDAAFKKYSDDMEQFLKVSAGVKPELLEEKNKQLTENAVQAFKHKACFGTNEKIDEFKQELVADIVREYVNFQAKNSRKLEQALAAFGGLALVAASAFLIDRITDWTCTLEFSFANFVFLFTL